MRSIRDLVRHERAADMCEQFVAFVQLAHSHGPQNVSITRVPYDRGLYAGWQRSWSFFCLAAHTLRTPIVSFTRLQEALRGG